MKQPSRDVDDRRYRFIAVADSPALSEAISFTRESPNHLEFLPEPCDEFYSQSRILLILILVTDSRGKKSRYQVPVISEQTSDPPYHVTFSMREKREDVRRQAI